MSQIYKSVKTACKNAKITYGQKPKDGFVFHDLRHSFATHARKAGLEQSVIMETTGHSTREMFDRYNTVDGDDTREAVNKLEDYFSNIDQSIDQEAVSEK